jgi:ribosomal protein S3
MISELVARSLGGVGAQEVFYMHVPASKTGLVIGKGGDTIKQVIQFLESSTDNKLPYK